MQFNQINKNAGDVDFVMAKRSPAMVGEAIVRISELLEELGSAEDREWVMARVLRSADVDMESVVKLAEILRKPT